jgi:hypothetical protein
MSSLSDHRLVLRLPTLLLPTGIAIGIVLLARRADVERAYAAGLAFLLVPLELLGVLVTTDTPLIAFTFASIAAFVLAVRRDSAALYVLAGVGLGLAFLSKYFAGLLGLAYLAFALFSPPSERRLRRVLLAFAAAAPFALVNLAWNYQHCWANILHNFYGRANIRGASWTTIVAYAAIVVYATSPILLWQLARARDRLVDALGRPEPRLLLFVAVVPLLVFGAVSPVRSIGVHWVLAFTPALFLVAAWVLTRDQLMRSVRFLAAFSAVHVIAIAVVAALPVETWQRLRQYDSIVMGTKGDEVLAALKPYEGRFEFATDGFSSAALLGYAARREAFRTSAGLDADDAWRRSYVFVFGEGSGHGRHDDILTDFRRLAGKDILVLRKSAPEAGAYDPYFESVEIREIEVRGARYFVVLGRDFRYEAYRARVLAPALERFYRIPAFLPQGRCYFCERYAGSATCPTR